jgi:hypothetical protein
MINYLNKYQHFFDVALKLKLEYFKSRIKQKRYKQASQVIRYYTID